MGKYIDIKYTTWQRAKFSDKTNMEDIIKELKETPNPSSVWGMDGLLYTEVLSETEEYITPDKNNGYATIEVYDDEKILYKNGN